MKYNRIEISKTSDQNVTKRQRKYFQRVKENCPWIRIRTEACLNKCNKNQNNLSKQVQQSQDLHQMWEIDENAL